uniref:Uncharacterized protein n=1 Tax=Tanacetum cinerariifolium TaxID=118510 RepID=A0A699H3E8_TANCI|nr:hypothetical protein [Tanacetum cinerariifolium]
MGELSIPQQTPPQTSPLQHDQPPSPGTPIPYDTAPQVDYDPELINFKPNNEVALLYPGHPNKEHFKVVSDFISKCCLREAFSKTPTQYKEYLVEFWYNAKVLEKSNKAWFSTLTGGIKGEVGVTSFRNAIGENYLGHSKGYVEPPTLEVVREWILTIGYSGTIKATCTLKKGFLPPREKAIPDPRFLSLLLEHKMEGYGTDEVNFYPTQIFSIHNWALKNNQPKGPSFTDHMLAICNAAELVAFKAPKNSLKLRRMVPQGTKPRAKTRRRKKSIPLTMNNHLCKIEATKSASLSNEASGSPTGHSKKRKQSGTAKDTNPSQHPASTLVIAGMHKEVQQATSGPVSLGVTDSTAEADRGKTAPNDSLSQQQGIDKGTKNYLFDYDITCSNPSVLVDKTQSDRDRLETTHTKIGTEYKAIYVQVEFNTSTELTNSNDATKEIKLEDLSKLVKDVGIALMGLESPEDDLPFIVQSDEEEKEVHAKPHAETKKEKVDVKVKVALLSAQPSFPNMKQLTELLELPSKFKEISREIRYLKSLNKKVVKMNNQKLEASNGLLALQVQVSSITAQLSKLEDLDALPSLLDKVTEVINRFATAITSASQTTDDTSVLSAGQVGTHPIEGKKNTQQATIIHLLKTTPRPKREQVKNKANEAISYKEAEEKESESDSDTEIRLTDCMVESSKKKRLKKFSFVDEQGELFLMTKKEMKTQKKINQRMINLHKTKEELKLDFVKPLGEQDPIIKLNDLAKKKRKHANDLHYYFRSTKRYKSPVKYEDHPAGTILNEQSLGMILFNSHQRQDFVSIEDFEDLSNEMLYTMQEIFFRLHQRLG